MIYVLYGAGILFLVVAAWFWMIEPAERIYYADRTFTDFSGDVQAWLRSNSNGT